MAVSYLHMSTQKRLQQATRDTLKVVTPVALGEAPQKVRTERIGGILELAGG